MSDADIPEVGKPIFLSKELAESAPYRGADEVPKFDNELEALPELDTDMPARGKGPSAGYETRWREIARLHAHGYTNNQIAAHLGYSAPGISLALNKPFVKDEIARLRAKYYSQDVTDMVKDVARDGMRRIHRTILDPKTKDSVALAAATWSVEKAYGKAKQEVSVESGTLSGFMELLNEMRDRGEPLDVTPQILPEIPEKSPDSEKAGRSDSQNDDWATWIAENVR